MVYSNEVNKMKEDCEGVGGVLDQRKHTCEVHVNGSKNKPFFLDHVKSNIKELAGPTKELAIERMPQNIVYIKKDKDSITGYSATCDLCSSRFPIEKSINTNSFVIGEELSRARDYSRLIDTAKSAVSAMAIVACPHCGIAMHIISNVL